MDPGFPDDDPMWVSAAAPATVANVVCGFDVFGFAVHQPSDRVRVRWLSAGPGPQVSIGRITGDDGRLPIGSDRNTAGVAILRLMHHLGLSGSVEMELHKGLPLGSGLGSSAASSVAALVAFDALAGLGLSRRELLPFAIDAERMACGAAHADNVAPGLLGGFVLIRGYEPLDVVSIPYPETLHAVLVHPAIELETRDSRQVLKGVVPLKDAVAQWGNTAGLVAGLMMGDLRLIARSMTDHVVEPTRGLLIPGYTRVKDAALDAGALGAGISGSGPTLFALCDVTADERLPSRIGSAMQEAFSQVGLQSTVFHSPLSAEGARLIPS